MKIGVVSDTHGYFDPRLPEVLSGAEVILHAGDVDSPDILEELEKIAPVHAVRGNVDGSELNLPLTRTLQLAGVQIEMQHILPAPQAEVERWANAARQSQTVSKRAQDFRRNFDDATRIVIFGHSHEPCLLTLSQTLFFNPGSAGKRRFSLPRCCGWLEITTGEIRAGLIGMEVQGGVLPEDVRITLNA